jgi:hypothetical protein
MQIEHSDDRGRKSASKRYSARPQNFQMIKHVGDKLMNATKKLSRIALASVAAAAFSTVAVTGTASAEVKTADDLMKAADSNNDGVLQRGEYVAWCAHKGAVDFDKMSGGAASMPAADAFAAYQKLLSYVD